MKITKLLFLSLLVFQMGHVGGMELSDMPMDIMLPIVRHTMWMDVENREDNQLLPPKKCKYSKQCECHNQNNMWHTIKRNHALQLISKDFTRVFWHCFTLPEFTLRDKDKFISKLLRMWNTSNFSTVYRSGSPMPSIADMAISMQASLSPVLYRSIVTPWTDQKCNPEFVCVILESGNADKIINQRYSLSTPFTFLCLAVLYRHLEIVELLLKYPAIDVNDTFPLYWAAYHGQTEMVKLLLAHPQIQVNALDCLGETVLFVFVRTGFSDEIILRSSLDLLVHAGADSTIKNKDGKTVLDVVRERPGLQGKLEVFEQEFAFCHISLGGNSV